jgi:hypothetical protein
MTAAEITAHALKLDETGRVEVLNKLLDSLEEPDPNDFDSDSLTEAIHRSNEIKLGLAKTITREELWKSVNESRAR